MPSPRQRESRLKPKAKTSKEVQHIMKKILVVLVSLLITALPWGTAGARGNRAGGSTSHSEGSTSHTSAAGTSTSHTAGQGSSHTNEYGGSTSHAYGQGTTHTNAYGGSASHAEGGGWSKTGAAGGTAYGDAHYGTAYHPPTAAAGPCVPSARHGELLWKQLPQLRGLVHCECRCRWCCGRRGCWRIGCLGKDRRSNFQRL